MFEPDASAPVQRRLAAILCADLRGYSRLMADDEAATLRMLARFRRLTEQVIRHYGGRVANTAGDSLLVEFASATDALRGALDIQSRIAGANEDVRPDRRAQYRMGLHVGEISVRQGDLFGDAVNLAARLEAIAPAGTVCLSSLAHQFTVGTSGVTFESFGAKQVKNFSKPIETYLALAPPPTRGEIPAVHRRILFYLARRFQAICNDEMEAITKPAGLSPLEYSALASLEDAGGLDASGLARRVGLDVMRATEILSHLEALGLVTTSDGSMVRDLTETGSSVRQRHKPEVVTAIERVVGPLSDGERVALHDMLARIIHAYEIDNTDFIDTPASPEADTGSLTRIGPGHSL